MSQDSGKMFSLEDPVYNIETYWGRYASIFAASNVRYAFLTEDQVRQKEAIINAQKAKEAEAKQKTGKPHVMLSADEISEIGHARNVVAAAIHPDTGNVIPMPMRITFFLPANVPISMGFLFSAPTMFNTILWQTVNQTYNAVLNYGNANKSSPATTNDIITSYLMALGASVGGAVALRMATKNAMERTQGGKKVIFNVACAMFGCATGGFANNWFMRAPETVNGIAIQDPNNDEIVGVSKICAESARWQTASSRILMAMPVGFPGIVFYILATKNMAPTNATVALMLQLGLISAQLTQSVPLSMALFPQIRMINASDLEPEFHNVKSKVTGEVLKEFKYNKGL